MSCCATKSVPVCGKSVVTLTQDDFGSIKSSSGKDRPVKRFTWKNLRNNAEIQVASYGATILTIKFPDKNGIVEDVITGFDTVDEYLTLKNRFYGATIGRVANRTAKGKMKVEGQEYQLAVNNGPNHLHGGIQGFDKVIWAHYTKGNTLWLTYHSADMEEGYPGDLIATVSFELTSKDEFLINYKAVVSKPCPVNLTNHSYFNLAGHGKGAEELYKHEITINADRITEVDDSGTPSGNLSLVSGTVFDLRVPKVLSDVIHKVPNCKGYDHNYCITKASCQEITFAAKAYHPPSGRVMEIYTNQPGIQFYTGNFLPEDDRSQGKGAIYKKHGAFCFETQMWPDSVNHAHFPKIILYPGEEYHHSTVFKFFVQK